MNTTSNLKYSQTENDFLRINYPVKGARFCAKTLGRTCISIRSRSQKLNLKVDSKSNIMMNYYIKPNEKYKVNADLFITPTIPEVIYTMGLIWADGHIHIDKNIREIEVTSTYPDGDEFYKIMSSYGKWNYYKYDKQHPRYKHLKPRIVIRTNNRPLSNFFVSYGYKSKSIDSADKVLKLIPEHLQYYWFRGLFDGDGSLYIKGKTVQISISGPYNQSWDYLTTLLNKLEISFSIYRRIISNNKNHKFSEICFRGVENARKFLSYIYQNADVDNIYLQRKYKKWVQFLSE